MKSYLKTYKQKGKKEKEKRNMKVPEILRKTIDTHTLDLQETKKKIIFLFDVDGTLTPSRLSITPEMTTKLLSLKEKVYVGFVGGSNYEKQHEQLKESIAIFDYSFPENGLSFYRNNKLCNKIKMIDEFGEDLYKKLVNRILFHLSETDYKIKRGTFIEYRDSILNISIIGRSCSQQERMEFFEFDKKAKLREKLVKKLAEEFKGENIHFSIGGQISIDIFPKGWDKRFCLQFLEDFEKIYFFGDMTMKGGNDYEIFKDERTSGITVRNPEDTMEKIDEILKKEDL